MRSRAFVIAIATVVEPIAPSPYVTVPGIIAVSFSLIEGTVNVDLHGSSSAKYDCSSCFSNLLRGILCAILGSPVLASASNVDVESCSIVVGLPVRLATGG
jgi:hypothetical protein